MKPFLLFLRQRLAILACPGCCRSPYAGQAGFNSAVLLLQFPECWDHLSVLTMAG